MALGRLTRVLLRVATGLTLVFIYLPIALIVVYAVQHEHDAGAGRRPASPSSGRARRSTNTGLQHAFMTSITVALGATAIALVLGHARVAGRRPVPVLRTRDRSRSSWSSRSPCRASSPAWRSVARSPLVGFDARAGSRSSSATPPSASSSSTTTRSPGCAGRSRSFEEASADLGADTWQTFRTITFPADALGAVRRGAPRVRALVRRGDRDDLHRRAACRRCRSGSSRASGWPTRSRSSTSPALVAILLSVIPVYIASRITEGEVSGAK